MFSFMHVNVINLYLTHIGPEDGKSIFLRNVGIHLQVYLALQPTRPITTSSQLGKPRTKYWLKVLRDFFIYTQSLWGR